MSHTMSIGSGRLDPNRLRARREALGLTRATLAQRILVNWSTLNDWEQGRRLPRSRVTLRALAEALRCDLAEITVPDPADEAHEP